MVGQKALETENYCAMPISHLLTAKDVIIPEDLVGFPLKKAMSSGPFTWEEEEQIIKKTGVAPNYVMNGYKFSKPACKRHDNGFMRTDQSVVLGRK